MITVKAYAKLNLILNVKGKRPDGYHEIETVFQAISLCDSVGLERAEDDKVVFLPSGKYLSDIKEKGNLAYKALKKAKEVFGREDEHFLVSIEKNIPLAGGLAGGSADAAAVLTGLAKIWNLHGTDMEKLHGIASDLGSDVPFCLAAQNGLPCAIGRGRGEKMEYIEPIKARVDLFFSEDYIKDKTAAVYNALIPGDYLVQYDIDAFVKAKTLDEKIKYMGNHLKPAFERLTGKHREEMLCGAGPTYFRFDKEGEFETIV